MAALTLAALALALAERPPEESPPPPVPQCGGYLILNGVGLTGGAGKKTANNVSSAAACCQICRQSSCAAWTYHPAGGHSPEQCNTAAQPGARHQSNGAVSGCVPGPSNAGCAAKPAPPSPAPGPSPSPPHKPPHIPPVPPPLPPGAPPRPPLGFQPNIVMVLTDDQDVELGGMEPMPQARKLLGEAGATFRHFYINTPVCCPSRSEFLSGRLHHNIRNREYGGEVCGGDEGVSCHDVDTPPACGCMQARPALLGSWDAFRGPSQTRMRQCAC